MGVRHSVSYIKLLVTGWTAGVVKQDEGRVIAARCNKSIILKLASRMHESAF